MTWEDRLNEASRELRSIRYRMDALMSQSSLRSQAIGIPAWDRRLAKLGRWVLEKQGGIPDNAPFNGPDVYVATHLHSVGGHTRLIGDFMSALEEPAPAGIDRTPRLFLTDLFHHPEGPACDRAREGLPLEPENLQVLPGETPGELLDNLITRLRELRPARLFLFHHPGDPIPVAAAQEGLAGKRFLVHHADAVPSLGLHMPGMLSIELHPFGAALSRVLGIPNQMLPLMCPDPGPRPHGFRRQKSLVTAASGQEGKFRPAEGHQGPTYLEAVITILRTTGGRHVHIGPLHRENLMHYRQEIAAAGLCPENFVHIPWVSSLAQAFWDQEIDLYLSSFPIDGARTNTEVAASGTPILTYLRESQISEPNDPFRPDGAMCWGQLEDLSAHLRQCEEPGFLEEKSRLIRGYYERLHHPQVFAETLRRILEGGLGVEDPLRRIRDSGRMTSLMRVLVQAEVALVSGGTSAEGDVETGTVGESRQEIEWLHSVMDQNARQLALLKDKAKEFTAKNKKLQQRVKALETERAALRKGRGWRARLRRWLLKP